MTKTLVIGAGGVGSVAVHKMAMLPKIFSDITLASRRQFKCDEIAASVLERKQGFRLKPPGLTLMIAMPARFIQPVGAKLVS